MAYLESLFLSVHQVNSWSVFGRHGIRRASMPASTRHVLHQKHLAPTNGMAWRLQRILTTSASFTTPACKQECYSGQAHILIALSEHCPATENRSEPSSLRFQDPWPAGRCLRHDQARCYRICYRYSRVIKSTIGNLYLYRTNMQEQSHNM